MRGKSYFKNVLSEAEDMYSNASGRRSAFRGQVGGPLLGDEAIPNPFGCTMQSASNYNPMADEEDGSCLWETFPNQFFNCGHWNPILGYHMLLGDNQGNIYPRQCIYATYGCTDPSATNFDPDADQDWVLPTNENGTPLNFAISSDVYYNDLDSIEPTTLCEYASSGGSSGGGIVSNVLTSGKDPKGKDKRRGMRSATGTSNDFGGLTFECQDEPFASVTGKGKEGYDEPDISSEPPWWALTALGWVAGLKKQKSCICPQQDGSSITLTDCNRLRPCNKCCTNSTGGYAGGGYDPNQSSLTEG